MSGQREGTLRGLIPEDLLKFSWLEEIALSPDGERAAYTVRRPEGERNGYQTDLYVMTLDDNRVVRVTQGAGQASSPAWSRDGTMLAFVWVDESGVRIRVVSADGGE